MTLKIRKSSSVELSCIPDPPPCKLSIWDLPDAIYQIFANFLSMSDLARTAQVQRAWRHLTKTDGCLDFFNSNLTNADFNRYIKMYDMKIVSLNMRGCNKLTAYSDLKKLAYLTELHLPATLKFLDHWVKFLTHLPIKTLTINCYDESDTNNNLTTETVLSNISQLPLKTLTFTCAKVGENTIAQLKKLSLEKLDLTIANDLNITEETLRSLSKLPVKSLRILRGFGITDESLSSISQLSLEELRIDIMHNVTVAGLAFICQPFLKKLAFRYCSFPGICPKGFEVLFTCRLTRLDLSETNISDECVQYFKPTLQHLVINYADITDFSLKILSTFPLISLEMESCNKITDEGVCQLKQPSLKFLNVSHCALLTQKSIDHIATLSLEKYKARRLSTEGRYHVTLASRIKQTFSNLF